MQFGRYLFHNVNTDCANPMKKLLIALPFVAGAAFAGTSHYSGSQTESEYHKLLVQLNENLPLKFENETYSSGLASSEAVTKVMAKDGAGNEVLFRLHHAIAHTPVRMDDGGVKFASVGIETTLHPDTQLPAELKSALTEDQIFVLRSNVKLGGITHSNLNISGFKTNEDGNDISWDGLNFEGTNDNGRIIGEGNIGKASVMSDMMEFTFAGGDINADLVDKGNSLFVGTGGLTLNNISVTNPMLPMPVKVAKVDIRSNSEIKGELINSSGTFAVKGIESLLPVNDAKIDVRMDGLSIEGMSAYNEAAKKYSTNMDALMGNDDEALFEILAAMRNVITTGSNMKYAVQLANDDGKVDADFTLGVKQANAPGMSADALDKIVTGRDLLNVIELNGMLDADMAALQQTPVPMMAAQFEEYLTITNDKITSKVTLEGTTIKINQFEMPLEAMLGDMLDTPLADLM